MELGMHFRLDDVEVTPLLAAAGDFDALYAAVSVLEENELVFARGCETDKAWDPIACALSPAATNADGPWPARGVIGGARALHDDDDGWVTHSTPEEVIEIAEFLAALTDEEFGLAYDAMPEELRNPEYGDDEKQYALSNLADLRVFYSEAQREGAHVVFSMWG